MLTDAFNLVTEEGGLFKARFSLMGAVVFLFHSEGENICLRTNVPSHKHCECKKVIITFPSSFG